MFLLFKTPDSALLVVHILVVCSSVKAPPLRQCTKHCYCQPTPSGEDAACYASGVASASIEADIMDLPRNSSYL